MTWPKGAGFPEGSATPHRTTHDREFVTTQLGEPFRLVQAPSHGALTATECMVAQCLTTIPGNNWCPMETVSVLQQKWISLQESWLQSWETIREMGSEVQNVEMLQQALTQSCSERQNRIGSKGRNSALHTKVPTDRPEGEENLGKSRGGILHWSFPLERLAPRLPWSETWKRREREWQQPLEATLVNLQGWPSSTSAALASSECDFRRFVTSHPPQLPSHRWRVDKTFDLAGRSASVQYCRSFIEDPPCEGRLIRVSATIVLLSFWAIKEPSVDYRLSVYEESRKPSGFALPIFAVTRVMSRRRALNEH